MRHPAALGVLLIEECAAKRLTYRQMLEEDSQYRYQVRECEAVGVGLEWCQRTIPDLILLGVATSDLTGLEGIQRLRLHVNSTQSAIILLAEQSDLKTAVQAMKSGAQDYLVTVQLTPTVLLQSIHSTLAQLLQARQTEQRREPPLTAAIALRIRQSLQLEEILATTTEEVRQFLNADRVLVYQFHPDMSGMVVAESVLPGWPVMLGTQIGDTFFQGDGALQYRQGRKQITGDIYHANLADCHVTFLEQFKVRAILVVPILVSDQLWGLLVAHQCSAPRPWQAVDLELMDQLSVHFAIAIQQASHYQQLQLELTQRKQAELFLQHSEATLQLFVQYAPAGIAMLDRNLCYLIASQRWIEDYRLDSVDAIIGRSHYEVFPDIPERWRRIHQRCLAGAIERCEEDLFEREDGSQQWVHWEVRPWYTTMGSIGGIIIFSEDITARKQAETTLLDSEERFRSTFEQAAVGIGHLSLSGEFLRLNQRFCDITGYSQTELRSLTFQEITHPDDLVTDLTLLNSLLYGRIPTYSLERRYIRKDRSLIWVNLTVSRVSDHLGQPKYLIAVIEDITARKQAEAELLQLAAIVESSSDAIIGTTLDGVIMSWNTGAEKLLGYKAMEAVGHSILMLIPPEHQHEEMQTLNALRQGEPIEHYETVWQRQDGTWVDVSLTMSSVKDAAGTVVGASNIARDISGRKQIEAERLQAEQVRFELHVLEMILDTILAGYWDANIPENKQYTSPGFKRMFGYEDHELPNAPDTWKTLVFPEDLPGALACFERHVQSRGVVPYCNELRYRHKNGSTVWVMCAGRVLAWDEAGHPLRMIGCHVDITERKKTEEQLRQTNEQLALANLELERATRLKDEFLANMSHELRTPLNAILGMSEAMQDEVFGFLNERQLKAIALIERSGKHLLELINDILDLSKIESGKLELDLNMVSLHQLADISLTFVQQMAHQKGIRLRSHVPDDVGVIEADDRRLRQVLINLLNNAIKFTPEGGTITLEIQRHAGEANGQSTNSWITFSVMDTGIGIASDNFDKLFQPFVQIDSRLNRQYSGTGLGLSLVRRIAELHGGTVAVSSELGRGSCFTVWIPTCPPQGCTPLHRMTNGETAVPPWLASPPAELKETAPSSPSPLDTPLILIAEDNADNVATLTAYLEGHGYRFIVASNGQEAVTLAQTRHPDLILMDVQMPGVDGLEAVRQIRADAALAQVPIVMLTALAMPGDREKCLATGATDYLSKPVSFKQLITVMQRLL